MRLLALVLLTLPAVAGAQRVRARDLGVKPGVFSPGPLNSITDVKACEWGMRP